MLSRTRWCGNTTDTNLRILAGYNGGYDVHTLFISKVSKRISLSEKVRTTASGGNVTAAICYDIHRVILVYATPRAATVTQCACQVALGLEEVVRSRRPGAHTILPGRIVLTPSHSLDLAPFDFHVWQLKNRRSQRFQSDDTVKSKVLKWFRERDVSFNLQGLGRLCVR
jgi:hypothetical protein